MRSSMEGLARPVRTELKLRFTASTDLYIFSICKRGGGGRRSGGCRACGMRVGADARASRSSEGTLGKGRLCYGHTSLPAPMSLRPPAPAPTASSSTVISTPADACTAAADRRTAALRWVSEFGRRGAFRNAHSATKFHIPSSRRPQRAQPRRSPLPAACGQRRACPEAG